MTQTIARDVITVLRQDHHEIEELFVRWEELAGTRDTPEAPGERAEARRTTDQAIAELDRHGRAAAAHLYPAVREYLPGLRELADHEMAEHAAARQNLVLLETLDPTDEEFWVRGQTLIGWARTRMQVEESLVFPGLAGAVPNEMLVELGGRVESGETDDGHGE